MGHKGREEGPPSQGLTLHCRLLLQVSQVLPLLLNCPMPCKEAQGKGGSVPAGLHLASTHREGPGPADGHGQRHHPPLWCRDASCFLPRSRRVPVSLRGGLPLLPTGGGEPCGRKAMRLWGLVLRGCKVGDRNCSPTDPRWFLAGGTGANWAATPPVHLGQRDAGQS